MLSQGSCCLLNVLEDERMRCDQWRIEDMWMCQYRLLVLIWKGIVITPLMRSEKQG